MKKSIRVFVILFVIAVLPGWLQGFNLGFGSKQGLGLISLASANDGQQLNTNMKIIGSVSTSGKAGGVKVSGDTAYVTVEEGQFLSIDISDPTNPTIIDSLSPPGSYTLDFTVVGQNAFLACSSGGLQVIDISDPTNLKIIGSVDIGDGKGIVVINQTAYMACGNRGFQVIDVSDPANPKIIGSVSTDYAQDLTVVGQTAFVAEKDNNFKVIDVSDPTNPEIISSWDILSYAWEVTVINQTAFVGCGSDGVKVIDVSDPTNPIIVGSVDTPGYAYGVRIIDQIAYVVNGNGIHAIDISDHANPFIIDSLDTPGHAREFTIVNQKAFVADYSGGLQVIDLGGGSLTECGAYIAPGVWKEFDCYNLAAIGKNTNDDPFTPSWRLIGGYWKWGRKGPDPSQWYDKNNEHFAHGPTGPDAGDANSVSISGWDTSYAPDGAWSDASKTSNDPCPAGYRVPTKNQWEGVLNNNTQSIVGSSWSSSNTNYSSAWFFGDDLLLPAAGYRFGISGALTSRGVYGAYWTSIEGSSDPSYETYEAGHLYFGSRNSGTDYDTRLNGLSVRCISDSEDPPPMEGWRYDRNDLAGTNYYVNTSTVQTANNLEEKFILSGTGGDVLTGDVTGDGFLEIVHVSGNQLDIYSYQGDFLKNVTLGSSDCNLGMIADINGDGIDDIGIGTNNTGSLKTWFYDGNGTLLQTLSKTAGYDSYMTPVGLTAHGDFIISFTAGYSHANKHRGFAVYDKTTGQERWNYKVGPSSMLSSITDFDNDGILEFTNSASTVHNGCTASGFNGNGTTTTDGDMWLIVVDENGNEMFSRKYTSPSDGSASHYFVDLNKEGQMQILGFEKHDPTHYRGISQVHLYDQSGTVVNTFNGMENSSWTFAVADMTGDGMDEVVAGNSVGASHMLYILDGDLTELDSLEVDGRVQLVSDINGDGINEIVLLSSTGVIKILDNKLNVLDTFDVGAYGRVIASDLDNNGILDLIILTDHIQVLENEAEDLAPCTYSISPNSGDFPAGGGTDIVTVTTSDPDCTWTASEDISWASLSPTSGGGSQSTLTVITGAGAQASVTVSVDPNTGDARNGSATIAGYPYTLSQAGKPDQTEVILTRTSPNHTITSGSDIQVYGTAVSNQIILESGAKAELINFPGYNTIHFQSSAEGFTVSRSGMVVTFQGTDGTQLKIPASQTVQTVGFADRETLTLIIHDNQVMLDDQVITTVPALIENSSTNLSYCGMNGQWDEINNYCIGEYGHDSSSVVEQASSSTTCSGYFKTSAYHYGEQLVALFISNGHCRASSQSFPSWPSENLRDHCIKHGGTGNYLWRYHSDPDWQGNTVGVQCEIDLGSSGDSSSECGAYVAPGVWKEFDCYNLAAIGKETGADPFIPSWELIGGYWQWGRKGPDSSQWYDTNTEHFAHGPTGPGSSEANGDSIIGWDYSYAPNDAWLDASKTANDPCPEGFRVPNENQLEGIINNNTQSIVGTWANSVTNYNSARFFGNDLMLPAAGGRDYGTGGGGGSLGYRGEYGFYLSSSEDSGSPRTLVFTSSSAHMNLGIRYYGPSVRCIAE